MGFNYLQTDDREDYFSKFNKKSTTKSKYFSLIDPNEKTILDHVPMYKIRDYANRYASNNKATKHIWRKLLESKFYKVINHTTPCQK